MKVPAHNLRENVCVSYGCVRAWELRGIFLVEQVHKLYMYANVHKELESLITLERFHTHTHAHTYTHTHMCTHAARQQVEPVKRSRAASESHLLVKFASHRQQWLVPKQIPPLVCVCVCVCAREERETKRERWRASAWLIEGERLNGSDRKSRPCSYALTLIVCARVCVCVLQERQTEIFVYSFSGAERWALMRAEGNRPNKAAPNRPKRLLKLPVSRSASISLFLSLSLSLSLSLFLSLITHSNSLDEAASSLECVSFLPSCW